MIYVSLTTIPQRIKNIKKSIDSLIQQTQMPDKIFVNIPKEFKRFKEKINDNLIPEYDNNIVQIVRSEDYGPGTKLLGSLDKLKKNSLIILADDDNIYENYMIEKFYYYYAMAPENAYSFYVHPFQNFGVGQGADGFAINSNTLDGVKKFYNRVIKNNKDLFVHDDLWISFFLFYVKKVKVLSLQSHLKRNIENKLSLIYKTHNQDGGLISTYGKNMGEAVRNRDQIALKNVEYMLEKIKEIKF